MTIWAIEAVVSKGNSKYTHRGTEFVADSSSSSLSPKQAHIVASVRKQAPWAAVAGGMMLYFGFSYEFIGDTFAIDLLEYTLQYGGVAMVVSALLLASGWPTALMLDGVFAMVIGIALALSGALMMVNDRTIYFQYLLYVVFGYLFFTSGLRSFRDFCRLGEAPDHASDERVATDASATEPVAVEPMGATPITPEVAPSEDAPPKATPDGYLADFGNEKRDESSK